MEGMDLKQKIPPKQAGLGYPLIEKLLETEDFDRINKSFSETYKKLEKIFQDNSQGLKRQKEARNAMTAYEYTTGLIRELLKVKYEILEQQKSQSKEKTK